MSLNFTQSQTDAIWLRGVPVLVSAAAGSGKTRVLTERLMSYITDDKNPCDISDFLVITYTRAAASELKERIVDSLALLAAESHLDRRLRRQQNLCYGAKIGTIHSFCTDILREYCHHVGLSPAFKVLDEDRAEVLKQQALDKVLEERYEGISENKAFQSLVDTVGAGRDDARLAKVIRSLHGKMNAHPYPAAWAKRSLEDFLAEGISDIAETTWGGEILDYLFQQASDCAASMEQALAGIMERDDAITKAYGKNFEDEAAQLRDFSRALHSGWDKALAFLPITFSRLGALRNYEDADFAASVKDIRDSVKKTAGTFSDLLSAPSERLLEQLLSVYPAMQQLVEITLQFDEQYMAEKFRLSLLDFSDLEHFAVKLLVDEGTGLPTAEAIQISQRFTEIMVDEYQDVNAVQEMIFSAISKDGKNLFMVGDVKQSIYRFRLADPGIFLGKYRNFKQKDEEGSENGTKIMLQENFRSRGSVLESANHVFCNIMSEALGEMEYDEAAKLRFGSLDYPEGTDSPTEFYIIEKPDADEDDESPNKTELEAFFVAKKIKEMVRARTPVYSKGGQRPCEYSDFAILLRSPSSSGSVFSQALLAQGIPVAAQQGGGFFTRTEVSVTINLLTVIDNPHNDVPLISVLGSPIFTFSPDELSQIRSCKKESDFYGALIEMANSGDSHCKEFLDRLTLLRKMSCDISITELLWHIFGSTNLFAVCAAMDSGGARHVNLMYLLECAKLFEASGYKGLFQFISYLKRMAERGEEPSVSGGDGNFVRITSIHKSKGLEFPFVFLPDLSRKFNKMDLSENLLMHPQLGLGPKITDVDRGIEFPTAARNAIRLRLESELLSEEMRVLYVAMTRAKERLIMTCVSSNAQEKLDRLRRTGILPIPVSALRKSQSLSDWLILAFCAQEGGLIKMQVVAQIETEEEVSPADETAPEAASQEEIDALAAKIEFIYPYETATSLPTKLTATEIKEHLAYRGQDKEAMSLSTFKEEDDFKWPDFDGGGKKSAASRGTATHLLLQYIDYEKTSSLQELAQEKARLCSEKLLTQDEADAADDRLVLRFIESEIGQRIKNADKIYREFRFTILEDASEYFGVPKGEQLLIQGIVDCFIIENGEITIIDYKTDSVTSQSAKQRADFYVPQLETYKKAISQILGMPVKQTLVYFLKLQLSFEM